jgi:ubiquitin C-terminal hydrolase
MLNTYFRGDNQHDAHELLRCVLDNLHEGIALRVKYDYNVPAGGEEEEEEEKEAATKVEGKKEAINGTASTESDKPKPAKPPKFIEPASVISEIFQGQMVSQITCQECGNVSTTQEPFYDISLELPKEKQMKKVHTHTHTQTHTHTHTHSHKCTYTHETHK